MSDPDCTVRITKEELDRLKREHEEMRQMVLHLAQVQRPEMEEKQYWLPFGHHDLANLL